MQIISIGGISAILNKGAGMKNLFFLSFFIFITTEAMVEQQERWGDVCKLPGTLLFNATYRIALPAEVFEVTNVFKAIGCNIFMISIEKKGNCYPSYKNYAQFGLSVEEQQKSDTPIIVQLKLRIDEFEKKWHSVQKQNGIIDNFN